MIYTVTFNPSLDYIVQVKDFAPGKVNRTEREEIFPGGKGINVSIVLKNLGFDTRALGFTAGFTGREIARLVNAFGCDTDFIDIPQGLSRINIKLKSDQESEINGQGPDISSEKLDALFEKLDALEDGDILILAGSIPNTLPEDVYERILDRLHGKEIRTVVDATCELLLNVLKYRPFLIKPNHIELGEMFGVELNNGDEIIERGRELQTKGARNVLVSMAGDGAILICENGAVLQSAPPKGAVVNSVGAGDSMVAGFLAGFLERGDYRHAFRMGIAAGSASAFQEWLATKQDILSLLASF